MKKTHKILILLATIFGIVNIPNDSFVLLASSNEYSQPTRKYQEVNEDIDAFYTAGESYSVKGLKGDELLERLAKILEDNHKYYNTYGELRGSMCYSDEDPDNKDNIIYFYSKVSASNMWSNGSIYNREHVWCKANSSGLFKSINNEGRGAGADIHHLRPEDAKINSARSNKRFADLNHSGTELSYNGKPTGNYISSSYFEPRDDVKGDIARILMYMYTHYSSNVDENKDRVGKTNTTSTSSSGPLDITNMVYTKDNSEQSAWNLLLDWNNLDPVDEFEMNRNNYCTSITGVRNPFIDHPEFANLIWDTSTSYAGALVDISYKEHTLTIVEKTPSTCAEYGLKTHYKCSHCSDIFALNVGKYTITNKQQLQVEKANHKYDSKCDETCNNCNEIRIDVKHIDYNNNGKCDNCNKVIGMSKVTKIILISSLSLFSIFCLIVLLILKKKTLK